MCYLFSTAAHSDHREAVKVQMEFYMLSSIPLVYFMSSLLSWKKQKVNKKIHVNFTINMFYHISLPTLLSLLTCLSLSQCFYDQWKNMWDYWINLKGLISELLPVISLILIFEMGPWRIKDINCTMFSILTASDCVIETNITYREMKTKTWWV